MCGFVRFIVGNMWFSATVGCFGNNCSPCFTRDEWKAASKAMHIIANKTKVQPVINEYLSHADINEYLSPLCTDAKFKCRIHSLVLTAVWALREC